MLTTSQWMNAWKVFAKCMKSIWRGWIQTVPPSLTISVSCLTLLTTWQIWVALCTERTLKHTNHTTKTGLRRRYMSCCDVKLSRRRSRCIGDQVVLLHTHGSLCCTTVTQRLSDLCMRTTLCVWQGDCFHIALYIGKGGGGLKKGRGEKIGALYWKHVCILLHYHEKEATRTNLLIERDPCLKTFSTGQIKKTYMFFSLFCFLKSYITWTFIYIYRLLLGGCIWTCCGL